MMIYVSWQSGVKLTPAFNIISLIDNLFLSQLLWQSSLPGQQQKLFPIAVIVINAIVD